MSNLDFKPVLDAAEKVLGVIAGASDIPLVEYIPYVSTVLKFVSYGKKLVELGKTVEPDIADFVDTFANGLPSEEKRAALDARIAANHAKIQAFVPVAEEGEPE